MDSSESAMPTRGCDTAPPPQLSTRVANSTRYKLTYPDDYDAAQPIPLLLSFHGWGGSVHSADDLHAHGRLHGYAVASPEGGADANGTFTAANGYASWGACENPAQFVHGLEQLAVRGAPRLAPPADTGSHPRAPCLPPPSRHGAAACASSSSGRSGCSSRRSCSRHSSPCHRCCRGATCCRSLWPRRSGRRASSNYCESHKFQHNITDLRPTFPRNVWTPYLGGGQIDASELDFSLTLACLDSNIKDSNIKE